MARLSDTERERLALFIVEMIRQREHKGWSQQELADRAHVSKSLIAQVETYQKAPSASLADGLDQAYELPGTFSRLYIAVRGSAFPAAFASFATYEEQAATLLIWENSYTPGLAQTEEYAEAVLTHHYNVSADQVAQRVKGRLGRQAVLTRKDPPPPVLWILIDESVLYREIGSPAVRAAQLDHVAEMAQQPGVSVQIVPASAGAHPGLQGSFNAAEMRDGTTILYTEDAAGGRVTDDPETLAEVMQRWRYLSSRAMSADDSLNRIREISQQWKTISQANGARQLTAGPTVDHASKQQP